MYGRLIKNNIGYLNKNLTKGFLEIKGIIVTDNEAELITSLLKDNWNDLYQGRYEEVFKRLKANVKKETYESLLSLYLTTMRQYF